MASWTSSFPSWTSFDGVIEPRRWRDADVRWRHGHASMASWTGGNAVVLRIDGRIDRKQCRSDRRPWRHRRGAMPQLPGIHRASAESNEAMLDVQGGVARGQRRRAQHPWLHQGRATRQCSPVMAATAGSDASVISTCGGNVEDRYSVLRTSFAATAAPLGLWHAEPAMQLQADRIQTVPKVVSAVLVARSQVQPMK